MPTDDTAAIATLGGLRKELERLNQLAWQADEDTILGWADTEGYPIDGTIDADGQYSRPDGSLQVFRGSLPDFVADAAVRPVSLWR